MGGRPIEQAIEFEGPDTVAAVFLEPVQNSGGCFPPPPGYFQRVREICDKHDVLLVSDELDLRLRPARRRCSAATSSAVPGHDHVREGHDVAATPRSAP